MGMNNSRNAIIAERQAVVARLRLRGCTQREIVQELGVNPNTGEPWALGTINGDIKSLEKAWQEKAADDIAVHKALQYSRLEEHYRQAWANGDLREVRENIKTTMALFGTEAPKRTELTGADGNVLRVLVEYADDSPDTPETA